MGKSIGQYAGGLLPFQHQDKDNRVSAASRGTRTREDGNRSEPRQVFPKSSRVLSESSRSPAPQR